MNSLIVARILAQNLKRKALKENKDTVKRPDYCLETLLLAGFQGELEV